MASQLDIFLKSATSLLDKLGEAVDLFAKALVEEAKTIEAERTAADARRRVAQ